jgi:hypothetical protein
MYKNLKINLYTTTLKLSVYEYVGVELGLSPYVNNRYSGCAEEGV